MVASEPNSHPINEVQECEMDEKRTSPEDCANMEDIRGEIDHLDRAVISLIGKRFQYVKAAAKFKVSQASVHAPERFKAMLVKRRDWAQAEGLDPDAIEKLYSDLVKYFADEEMRRWKELQA